MQTKKQSLIESITNVVIGYIVAVISNAAILPLFGVNLPFSDSLLIGYGLQLSAWSGAMLCEDILIKGE